MYPARLAPISVRCLAVAVALLGGGNEAFSQADDWAIPEASIRFTLKLSQEPTHSEAGYFVNLPDGGILPGPAPLVTVVADGKALEAYQLWHHPDNKLAVVFPDPGKIKEVHLYVAGAAAPRLWTPELPLKPSAILCTDPTQAGLAAAKHLATRGPVGATIHARNRAGVPQAPLSIGGDHSGRPRPASFYQLSHVQSADPGKTWIAPFTIDGATEIYVDGQQLIPKKRIDKWGGTGMYFTLTEGLHRIEIFQTAPGTEPFSSHSRRGGLMYLTWRTPNATMKELGGVRSKKVPMPGTSRMETRVLNAKEIVRSGGGTLSGATTRDGGPVACIEIVPTHTFWFEGEEPLISYEMNALRAGHPRDTRYTWTFPGGSTVQRSTAFWLYPGFRENQVKLTSTSSAGTSESVQPFFGFATAKTSLNNPAHRQAFRAAMTDMLEAEFEGDDPVASWGPAHWNNLVRTTELGQGYSLLRNLFTQRLETTRQSLDPEQQTLLENVFLDMAQRRNPPEALIAIDQLIASADEQRRNELLIRKAELLMYYLGEGEKAKAGLTRLAEEESEMAEWARIRLGDIAFLAGDLNEATQYYADVQNRTRQKRNAMPEAPATPSPAEEPQPADVKEKGKRKGKDKGKTEENLPDDETGPAPEETAPPPKPSADWNATALLDVSNSENIDSMIEGGYLLEAQQALRQWEREFPLSKISGDFILVESRYFVALDDWLRVHALLKPYCKEVDASSFLPDAVRMLIQSVEKMNSPKEDIRDIVEKVQGSLKFHPVAEELDAFLSDAE